MADGIKLVHDSQAKSMDGLLPSFQGIFNTKGSPAYLESFDLQVILITVIIKYAKETYITYHYEVSHI